MSAKKNPINIFTFMERTYGTEGRWFQIYDYARATIRIKWGRKRNREGAQHLSGIDCGVIALPSRLR